MAETNAWNPEDIKVLSAISVDQYYAMFKVSKGRDMRNMINSCLQFDRIANATDEMKVISARAKDALKRIGQESRLNARRVRTYGIDAD